MKELRFFSDDLAGRYGRKLYRIPVDLALGCPNRPERFGPGCAFCAEDGSRARHLARKLDLPGQVAAGSRYLRERYQSEAPYIAYFQAFTSTNAPVETLRKLYQEVLDAADFRVVIVGTRPDALPEETVAFLRELAERYELWVELGVQSMHNRTLTLINRGHDRACVEEAVRRLDRAGINTACHVIAGLPGETLEEFRDTARQLAKLPFRAVKVHPLLVLKGTPLASPHFPVKPAGLGEYEYAHWLRSFLAELPDDWLLMRLTAEADPELVISPHWQMEKGQFLEFFRDWFQKGDPGILTADGSRTLYHPGYRQHFHSLAGAASEARHKFLEPARLRERLTKGPIRLLDIGFGLGINAFAAFDLAGELEITSLENDSAGIDGALAMEPPDTPRHARLAALRRDKRFAAGGASITLLEGDARQLVQTLDEPFDVIFLDAFSPDCNPELWSYDFLLRLKALLKPDGVLASYSSAYPFRGALLRAGFAVGESLPFGRKRGGTVAGLSPAVLPLPLPEKERNIILGSTAGLPYRDPTLADARQTLFDRREKLLRRLRARGVPKWYKAN